MDSDGISLILDVSLSGYSFLETRFPNVPYFKLRTSMIHSFIESVSLYVEQKYAYDGAFIFQNELGELFSKKNFIKGSFFPIHKPFFIF